MGTVSGSFVLAERGMGGSAAGGGGGGAAGGGSSGSPSSGSPSFAAQQSEIEAKAREI